jgi:hypothetical protein
MIIVEKGSKAGVGDYDVRFEERGMEDLIALNEDSDEMAQNDADFSRVAAVSKMNDSVYNTFFSPWVRMFSNPVTAEILRQLHPLRVNKYLFSDRINPFMRPFRSLSPLIRKERKPAAADNPFLALQNRVSDTVVAGLEAWQEARDRCEEALFYALYENPMMKLMFPAGRGKDAESREPKAQLRREAAMEAELARRWQDAMERGGYEAGVIRMIMALEDADHIIDRDDLYEDERLLESSPGFKNLTREAFLRMAHDQTRILSADENQGLRTLAVLIPAPEERKRALALARKIAVRKSAPTPHQKAVLSRIRLALAG